MKIIAIIALVIGGLISSGNWSTIYQSHKDKRHVSTIPILGAIFLGIGLTYFKATRPLALLCLIADYGTLLLIISTPRLINEAWKTSRFNLVNALAGCSQYTEYKLNLYKKGIFVIRAKVNPPQATNEHGALIKEFGFERQWEQKKNVIVLSRYANNREVTLVQSNNKYISRESNYPKDRKCNYDMLDGIEFTKNA
jgi:hypothetical protein